MKRPAALLAGFLPVLLAGCVEGHVGNLFKYDQKADAFHLVQFYTNLHATQARDLDHLANLWKKKNSIIVSPVDGAIFSTYALERLGQQEYRPVSLGEPDKQSPARKTRANLNSVQVLPGEFYLNQHGYLGCYQQAIVPGKVVDALIEDFSPDIFGHIAKEANRQIELADRTEKVRKLTWEEVRQEMVRQLSKNPQPRPKDEVEDQWPLEMASLKRLAQVGANGAGRISRAGDAFTIVLPVTAKDAKELASLANLVRTTAAKQIKAGQAEAGMQQMLEAVQVQATKEGISLTVQAGKFFRAFPVVLNPTPDASKQKGYQATVVGAQGRGLVLSNEVELRKLMKEFGVMADK